jgi:Protein of unknown function (DUF3433)
VDGLQGDIGYDTFFGTAEDTTCINSPPGQDDARLVIAAGRFTPNESLSFTGLICKPSYGITTKNVSLSDSGSFESIDSSSDPPSRLTPQITPWDIADGVTSSIVAAAQQILSWHGSGYDPDIPHVAFDAFFAHLNMTTPQKRATDFLDETLLRNISRCTFTSLAVQVAKQKLLISANDELAGYTDISQRRLLMQKLSLRTMEASLAVLVLSIGIIVTFRPVSVSSRDPGSIVGALTIFSRSSSFMKILNGLGLASEKKLKMLLAGRQYRSILTFSLGERIFKIEEVQEVSEPGTPIVETRKESNQYQWWRPFSVTVFACMLILLTPIALIAALEGTYQTSYRYDGILDIKPDTYVYYSWVYVPALVMLGIRALFDVVDFNTRVFQPYCALYHQSAPAERSIFVNYLGKTSIYAFCSGLAVRQFLVVFMLATMHMAPLLTIVASGLFKAQEVPQKLSIEADRLDWFNASALSDNGTQSVNYSHSLLSSLIMNTDLDYPR